RKHCRHYLLRRRAARAAADVPDLRLPRRDGEHRRCEPRQRPGPARRQPVRGDAEPARGRRAHRRDLDGAGVPAIGGPGNLAALAGLGLVRRDGDRQPLLAGHPRGHRRRAPGSARRLSPPDHPAAAPEPVSGLTPHRVDVKSTYADGARRIASRSMTGLARTRVTPSMLTITGVSLCVVASVLVYFEYRNEWLFFWAGSIV